MGASAQQILQSDPEYLQRQLQAQEMQRVNPTGSAAGALGALLGRGISNVSQGKGFFQAPDYGLQRVAGVQNIMNSVEFDPNNPAKYYQEVGNQLRQAGFGNLAPLAFQEARKLSIQDTELGIKQAKAGADAREAARKNVDYYKKNPEQAEFRIAQLAQTLSTDPTNAAALEEYTKITRAASEGAIEATQKAEKETVGLAKDRAQLAKYKKDLEDAQKFGPAQRWDAETDAARKLLQTYNIDITKPLEGQVKGSTAYGPMAGEISQAFERAVRKKTTEGGGPGSAAPGATPTAAPQSNDPLGIR